ncbi:hypothetical protein MIR68_010233 [Amoeboaphelidium protococcarum]|nr:hypothetical protein MIR68_010233 [Amoeboaphelidium protococcarum]
MINTRFGRRYLANVSNAVVKKQKVSPPQLSQRPLERYQVNAQKLMPSQILNRYEETYDANLAEDLAILGYDHFRHANPQSAYRRIVQEVNRDVNAPFEEKCQQWRMYQLNQLENQDVGSKSSASSSKKKLELKAQQLKAEKQRVNQLDKLSQYLDISASSQSGNTQSMHNQLNIYETLPRIQSVSIAMRMPQAVVQSKKVLLYGMLALNLCTGQQSQIIYAGDNDTNAKQRIRSGMPIAVRVRMTDSKVFGDFLGKFAEIVLPKLRDFKGFCKTTSNIGHHGVNGLPQSTVTLKMDAESWQSYPEISQAYLKFPHTGSVGSLQNYEIAIQTVNTHSPDDVKMLLSGYRIPFTFMEDAPESFLEELKAQNAQLEEIQDV